MWHWSVLSLHVVIAVIGLGPLAAIPLAARAMRGAPVVAAAPIVWLERLFLSTRLSLLAMFASGAWLELLSGGAYHESGWFRMSVVLLLAAGISHALARAALRRGSTALRSVEGWSWLACGLVALIVVLMEVKLP